MKENIKTTPNNPPVSVYDDDNIPEVDLPQSTNKADSVSQHKSADLSGSQCKAEAEYPIPQPVEPLPESTRPRKDGPGGN